MFCGNYIRVGSLPASMLYSTAFSEHNKSKFGRVCASVGKTSIRGRANYTASGGVMTNCSMKKVETQLFEARY
jgi:hypothetical protein